MDLNLLVYLDVLLSERNVTRAARKLGITQPAMSNSLRRLRTLFNDPLLVRTSSGMSMTERALKLQPRVRQVVLEMELVLEPGEGFDPAKSERVYRIMASDYAEATIITDVICRLRREAPGIIIDCLTPSDVSYKDMEQGKVDMAINRFDEIPESFHQSTVWSDSFSCLMSRDNVIAEDFNLDTYLEARHIWVSKTGLGVGLGVDPQTPVRLGWIDQALSGIGEKRKISIFTRHYLMPGLLVKNNDLVATLPTRVARMHALDKGLLMRDPPFDIPEFELSMVWSPLLHQNSSHKWLRQLIVEVARNTVAADKK